MWHLTENMDEEVVDANKIKGETTLLVPEDYLVCAFSPSSFK